MAVLRPKPKLPNPGDTQWPYPHEESRFLVMKYGDGWGVYCNHGDGDGHMITGYDEHPLIFSSPDGCEALLRYMMDSQPDSKSTM